jgi:hypothetical protein
MPGGMVSAQTFLAGMFLSLTQTAMPFQMLSYGLKRMMSIRLTIFDVKAMGCSYGHDPNDIDVLEMRFSALLHWSKCVRV